MNNQIPYAKSKVDISDVDITAWLRTDELLEKMMEEILEKIKFHPYTEFSIWIEFLIEYPREGTGQDTLSYKEYAEVLKRIKNRITRLYYEKIKEEG